MKRDKRRGHTNVMLPTGLLVRPKYNPHNRRQRRSCLLLMPLSSRPYNDILGATPRIIPGLRVRRNIDLMQEHFVIMFVFRRFSVALSSSENVSRLAETPQRDVPDYDVEVSTTFLEH